MKKLNERKNQRNIQKRIKDWWFSVCDAPTVLDVGCGYGPDVRPLHVLGKTIIGVDSGDDVEYEYMHRIESLGARAIFIPGSVSDPAIPASVAFSLQALSVDTPGIAASGFFFLNMVNPSDYHSVFHNFRQSGVKNICFMFYDPRRMSPTPVSQEQVSIGTVFDVETSTGEEISVKYTGETGSNLSTRDGYRSLVPLTNWPEVLDTIRSTPAVDPMFASGMYHLQPHPSLFNASTSYPGWEYEVNLKALFHAAKDYDYPLDFSSVHPGSLPMEDHERELVKGLVIASSGIDPSENPYLRPIVVAAPSSNPFWMVALDGEEPDLSFKNQDTIGPVTQVKTDSLNHEGVPVADGQYSSHKHECACGAVLSHSHSVEHTHGLYKCQSCDGTPSLPTVIPPPFDPLEHTSYVQSITKGKGIAGTFPLPPGADLVSVISAIAGRRWEDGRMPMQQYGYIFDPNKKKMKPTTPLLPPLVVITTAFEAMFSLPPGYLNSCIIRSYPKGMSLASHADRKEFGNYIFGITLSGESTLDFKDQDSPVGSLKLTPSQGFVMFGDPRYKLTHGISNKHGPRVSVTFRHVPPSSQSLGDFDDPSPTMDIIPGSWANDDDTGIGWETSLEELLQDEEFVKHCRSFDAPAPPPAVDFTTCLYCSAPTLDGKDTCGGIACLRGANVLMRVG